MSADAADVFALALSDPAFRIPGRSSFSSQSVLSPRCISYVRGFTVMFTLAAHGMFMSTDEFPKGREWEGVGIDHSVLRYSLYPSLRSTLP